MKRMAARLEVRLPPAELRAAEAAAEEEARSLSDWVRAAVADRAAKAAEREPTDAEISAALAVRGAWAGARAGRARANLRRLRAAWTRGARR